jgi:flagellin
MTISSIASIVANVSQTLGNSNSKLADRIKGLILTKSQNTAHPDIAALATATLLQSQISGLRVASQNIIQAQSLLAVADGGTQEISAALDRLNELSQRASSDDLSQAERIQLDVEFQQLRQQITQTASTTRFNGQALLDGSLDAAALGEDGDVEVGDLSDAALFKNQKLDLLSEQNAKAAAKAIAEAQAYVAEQQASIGALNEGLDYAGAAVATAAQNQEAARSFLDDNDIVSASTQSAQQLVQERALTSLLAQTNKLSGNILQLLNE